MRGRNTPRRLTGRGFDRPCSFTFEGRRLSCLPGGVSGSRMAGGPPGAARRFAGDSTAAGLRLRRERPGRPAGAGGPGAGFPAAGGAAGRCAGAGGGGTAVARRAAAHALAPAAAAGPGGRRPVGLRAAAAGADHLAAAHPHSAGGGRDLPHRAELLRRPGAAPGLHQEHRGARGLPAGGPDAGGGLRPGVPVFV